MKTTPLTQPSTANPLHAPFPGDRPKTPDWGLADNCIWDCDTANVHDGSVFQQLVDPLQEMMAIFADTGFSKVDWRPTHLRLCKWGEWNVRMLVETVLSMLTYVCHFKHMAHKSWAYFKSHLGYAIVLFNLLVQWHSLLPNDMGFVPLSIADFSL